jgi:hypothetical protein
LKDEQGSYRRLIEVLSRHLRKGAEQNHENPTQDGRWPSKQSSLEYNSETLSLEETKLFDECMELYPRFSILLVLWCSSIILHLSLVMAHFEG